jgi:TPR repeat protein
MHPIAMSNQAILLIKTNTTLDKVIFKEAMRLLLLATHIDSSLKDAYYYIGFLHECGYGTPQSPYFAYKYYKKANKRGHLKAKTKFALVLMNGLDNIVQQDEDKAIQFLQEAASKEEPEAMNYLALIYEKGTRKIPQSLDKCITLLKKAQDKGCQNASVNLAILHKSTLDETRINEQLYIDKLLQTARKGNTLARTILVNDLTKSRYSGNYTGNDEKELIEFDY